MSGGTIGAIALFILVLGLTALYIGVENGNPAWGGIGAGGCVLAMLMFAKANTKDD